MQETFFTGQGKIESQISTLHIVHNDEKVDLKIDEIFDQNKYDKLLAVTYSMERHDIPQFLFIGGVAGSGKSSLLKMLSKMLGISDKAYWIFSDLASGHRAKMGRVDALNRWVNEENVNPVLLDEISIDFFSNPNYGRDLILSTTNNKVDVVEPFPTIIGTTNADAYSLPAEARRRSYYLKIDKVFNERFREESPLEYKEIYDGMDNELFQDFVLRFAGKLENHEECNWSYFSEDGGKVDFLHEVRETFKDYYRFADMHLPRYFPTSRYSDDFETNQEKWRKLYKGTSNEDFKFDEVSGNIFFKTSSIDEYSTNIYGRKESESYKQALPQYVVHGSTAGIDIELYTEDFFKWLEIDNPYKNYYKESFVKLVRENESVIETHKDQISLPTSILSMNENLLERYRKSLPEGILIQEKEGSWFLDKVKLTEWTGVKFKESLFDRIFK